MGTIREAMVCSLLGRQPGFVAAGFRRSGASCCRVLVAAVRQVLGGGCSVPQADNLSGQQRMRVVR